MYLFHHVFICYLYMMSFLFLFYSQLYFIVFILFYLGLRPKPNCRPHSRPKQQARPSFWRPTTNNRSARPKPRPFPLANGHLLGAPSPCMAYKPAAPIPSWTITSSPFCLLFLFFYATAVWCSPKKLGTQLTPMSPSKHGIQLANGPLRHHEGQLQPGVRGPIANYSFSPFFALHGPLRMEEVFPDCGAVSSSSLSSRLKPLQPRTS